jgi:hypothetical protein
MKKLFFKLFFLLSIQILHAMDISPAHPNIKYFGRFDMINTQSPVISWPGSQIVVRFQGSSLKIKMSSQGDTYYRIQIDSIVTSLLVTTGNNTYTLCTALTDAEHIAKITKVAAPWTPQNFNGFIIDDGKTLLPPPDSRIRRIEFYGDSQTQGSQSGVQGMATDDMLPINDNNFFSYAAITARALRAEYVCIAQGGASLTPLSGKLNIPETFDRTGAGTSYSKWNFSVWKPDVVCINLGVNDQPYPADFTTKYVLFVQKMRQTYPDAHIFLLSGPMWNSIQLENGIINAVATVNSAGDPRVYYFKPSKYLNHPGHPRTVDNIEFAKELAALIKSKTWNENVTDIPAEEVFITPISIPLAVNNSRKLTAVVLPFDASNQQIIWTSSNPSVATVDANGVVTGKTAGITVIKAVAKNGCISYDYILNVQMAFEGNLIQNPGFESDFNYWNDWGNTKINTSFKRNGLKAMEIGPNAGGREQIISYAVEGNTIYTLSAWCKVQTGNPNAILSLKYTNLNGEATWIGSSNISNVQFEQKAITFTTPADVFTIHAIVQLQSSGASILADDIQLVKGNKPATVNQQIAFKESMKLYPNPVTNNYCHLELTEEEKCDINLFAMDGANVFVRKGLSGNQTIGMHNLKRGCYIARLNNSKGAYNQILVLL